MESLYLVNDKFLTPYLSFIKENKNIFKALKKHPNTFDADNICKNMFDTLFTPILDRFGLDKKWHTYIMDFYINGLTSIIIDWVNDDCKIDVKEISKFIQGLIVKQQKTSRVCMPCCDSNLIKVLKSCILLVSELIKHVFILYLKDKPNITRYYLLEVQYKTAKKRVFYLQKILEAQANRRKALKNQSSSFVRKMISKKVGKPGIVCEISLLFR